MRSRINEERMIHGGIASILDLENRSFSLGSVWVSFGSAENRVALVPYFGCRVGSVRVGYNSNFLSISHHQSHDNVGSGWVSSGSDEIQVN